MATVQCNYARLDEDCPKIMLMLWFLKFENILQGYVVDVTLQSCQSVTNTLKLTTGYIHVKWIVHALTLKNNIKLKPWITHVTVDAPFNRCRITKKGI